MAKEEVFSRKFIASMKRVAKDVADSIKKKEKIEKEILERQAQLEALEEDIRGSETNIRRKTGYGVMDLIKREVINTGKVDKNGKPIKVTQYSLIYPDTIVPPTPTAEGDMEVAPVEDTEKEGLPFMTEDVMNHSNEV